MDDGESGNDDYDNKNKNDKDEHNRNNNRIHGVFFIFLLKRGFLHISFPYHNPSFHKMKSSFFMNQFFLLSSTPQNFFLYARW
jgi:hypothetical protein